MPDAASPHRATTDKLAERLAAAFDETLGWLEVDERAWAARADRDGWSVGEVCEHLTLMHRYLLVLVDKIRDRARKHLARGERPDPTAPTFTHLDELARADRSWPSPEHMVPTGTVARDELRGRLESDRRRCLGYLREMPDGEGTLHTIRFSVVDARLDLYQFLYVIEAHLRRHLAQMERARDQL